MTLDQVLGVLSDVNPDRVRPLWETFVGVGRGPNLWEGETQEQAARRWYSRVAPVQNA